VINHILLCHPDGRRHPLIFFLEKAIDFSLKTDAAFGGAKTNTFSLGAVYFLAEWVTVPSWKAGQMSRR